MCSETAVKLHNDVKHLLVSWWRSQRRSSGAGPASSSVAMKLGEGFGKIDQLSVLISEVLGRVFALRSEGGWQSLFRLRPLRAAPRAAALH